jgi:hypothetical protein
MGEIDQDGAIKFFNKHGYLVINSMRRSGKTNVLRKIIELNEDNRIGILCPSYGHYKMHFNIYPNCEYVSDFPLDSAGEHFDILIGDEVFLQPMIGIKTACAYTNKYVEYSLHPTECALEQIAEIKMSISSEQFEIEFGQYMLRQN